MRRTKSTTLLLILVSAILWFVSPGFSQDFPSKPIIWVNPFSPGGGNGLVALAFQKPFEKELGTRILVENIPGGTTKMGTLYVMNAKLDGYTLILMSDMSWVGYYYSKTYDTKMWEKLTPIGNLTTEPNGFFEVQVESPYKTWADLVKIAKENPGKLTCASAGAGGMQQLMVDEVSKAAGIEVKFVPFAGAGPSKIALLGGHVDFRICQVTEAIEMIRAGKTRGLAINTDKRLEALPDVPTFRELGILSLPSLTRSVWGPPKLPRHIVTLISRAIEKATKDPDFVKIVETQFLYKAEYRPPERVFEEVNNFDKKYGAKLAEANK